MPVRVALIGVGRFGRIHLRCLLSLWPLVEVAAICDKDEWKLEEAAREARSARAYLDFEEMLSREEVDAVFVLTEEQNHAAPAIAAFEAGRHVFCEKPIASTLEEADRMIEASRRAGKWLFVGHILRFDPQYAQLRERAIKGEFGMLGFLHARRLLRASSFRHYARVPAIVHTGVHDIDIMLWIVGRKPEGVCARCRSLLGLQQPETFGVLLDFGWGGPIGVVENAWLLPDSFPASIEAEFVVAGDRGCGRIHSPPPGTLFASERAEGPDLFWWPSMHEEVSGALRNELLYFLRCLREGREPRLIKPEEARAALEVALAALESAKSGGRMVRL